MIDWLKRLALRWVMLYLVFYIFLSGIVTYILLADFFPPGLRWFGSSLPVWSAVVPWIEKHILGHLIPAAFADYTEIGIILMLAFVGALVWTILGRNRQHERTAYEVTRVIVRYVLAMVMLHYASGKIFHFQMFYPGPAVLMKPFGDFSPMHLMWAFMGVTTLYSFFGGFAEFVGGSLLLFRRTTTLGALVAAAVMTNVAVMDIAFTTRDGGFGLTLWVIQLLFMAIFLLAEDAQRLVNALVLYRPLPAVSFTRAWSKAWMEPASIILKVLIVGWFVCGLLILDFEYVRAGIAGEKLPWRGLYQVEHFSTSRNARAFTSSGSVWARVAIDGDIPDGVINNDISVGPGPLKQTMDVRTADDTMLHYRLQIDRIDATHGLFKLRLSSSWDTKYDKTHSAPILLHYVVLHNPAPTGNAMPPNNAVVALNGNVDGAPVSMQLNRLDTRNFLLIK